MKEPGYIYVMINPSMEGLVKIGKTTREPESRAKELSQATGVATPFYVAFSIFVLDCHSAEEFVHASLEHKGFRNTANREFFQMPLRQAIEFLMLAEKEFQNPTGEVTPVEPEGPEDGTSAADEAMDVEVEKHPGRGVFEQAIRVYCGEGDEIEDKDEAVRLLHRAKALNYPAAFTSLAQHFRNLAAEIAASADEPNADAVWANRQNALAALKEGAQKGHGRCWSMMAHMYLNMEARQDEKTDPTNANKCWKKYFRSATFSNDDDTAWTEDVDGVAPSDGVTACLWNHGLVRSMYIYYYLKEVACGNLPMDTEIRQLLLPFKEEVIEYFRRGIARAQQLPDLFNSADERTSYMVQQQEDIEFVQKAL
jgi:hypothetical protein